MSGIARKLMGVTKGAPLSGYNFLTGFAETANTSGTFSFAYSDVNLGTPAANRSIMGIAYSSSSQNGALDINTASFGGVAATRVINHSGTTLGGFNHAAYFLASVPAGTTGTISWGGVFSGSAFTTRPSIAVYALYGNPFVVSDATSASFGSSVSSRSANLPSVAVGDILFALAGNNSTATTHIYSPADYDLDFTALYFSNSRRRTFASGESSSSGTVTTQVTFSAAGVQANLSTAAIRL